MSMEVRSNALPMPLTRFSPLRQFTITVRIRRRIPITRTTRSTPPPLSASQAVSKVRLKECFIIVNRMLMELEAFSKLQV
jgi:hypothetical protein